MLDTNIVIYVMKRKPISVLTKFNQHAQQLCVSSITAAELFYGAEYSTRTAHNLRQVEDFLVQIQDIWDQYSDKSFPGLSYKVA